MKKGEIIKTVYSIVIAVFVVAMGVALICVAADIYYSEQGFPREVVVNKLTALAIPFIILIGMVAAGVMFPLFEVSVKPSSEDGVRLLSKRIPTEGFGEEYDNAAKKYKQLRVIQLIVWCVTGAIILGSAIASLCYLLNTAHFLSENITQEIFVMMQNVLPWIVVSFAALIAATIANGVIASRKLKEIKILIKNGSHAPKDDVVEESDNNSPFAKIKKALNRHSNIVLWVVRGVVFVVAVTFIIVGVLNGGAHDVLVKAINICTECIGLG